MIKQLNLVILMILSVISCNNAQNCELKGSTKLEQKLLERLQPLYKEK